MEEGSTLVKFGQKDYIENLYNHGELYMNNLPYFQSIEKDLLRHDPNECICEIQRGPHGFATLKTADGKDTRINFINWQFQTHPKNPENINIFCMYALRPFYGSFPVDKRNMSFGDTALVLLNGDRFIEMIGQMLNEKFIVGKADLVEYMSNDYKGKMGPFKKLDTFSYQSEWRLICLGGNGESRKLCIGSLKEISVIIPANEINNEIKIIP